MIHRPPNVSAFEFVVLAGLRAAQLKRGCIPRIDGVHKIITMAQIGSRHAACGGAFQDWLMSRTEGQALVRVQQPLLLSSGSEPEPDLSLVRQRADRLLTPPRPLFLPNLLPAPCGPTGGRVL